MVQKPDTTCSALAPLLKRHEKQELVPGLEELQPSANALFKRYDSFFFGLKM